jgi:pimeloyl-ACP methyl ester carboxylesterase
VSSRSGRPRQFGPYLAPEVSQDAIVIIPGIMGSTLVETATGDTVWGLDPGSYADAWTRGRGLRALLLTDDERAGRYGRISASGLLRAPAWAPVLRGVEPYTALVEAVTRVVGDPAAVLEFGYDWRLPVEYHAARLAECADRHLDAWLAHPRHEQVRAVRPDGRPGQLVLVAHSMGGLVVRAMAAIPGAMERVRAVVTLGTPFEGAAKAAVILNSGRGAPVPLPHRRLRRLAATLPGLHELLPTYRCVDEGDDVRRLTPDDVAALGGDRGLAEAAAEMHARTAGVTLPGHEVVIGDAQRTAQTLRLGTGVVTEGYYDFEVHSDGDLVRDGDGILRRVPAFGDGTVPARSATPTGPRALPLPQQHGSLARTADAIGIVRAAILGRHLGGRLGEGDVGIRTPDLVRPGQEWPVLVDGVKAPDATCTVYDAATNQLIESEYPLHLRDGQVQATVTLPAPGLYRVSVDGGGTAPVTQLVLAAAEPDAGDSDEGEW